MVTEPIRAAGGVVTRERDGHVEVLVVHRPRYDDWSLPKGKVDPGETDEQAARREVLEESGVEPRLHAELETVRYEDRKGRAKQVRYWHMTVLEEIPFVANHEVDEVRWLPVPEAGRLLTYEHDRALLTGRLESELGQWGGQMRESRERDA